MEILGLQTLHLFCWAREHTPIIPARKEKAGGAGVQGDPQVLKEFEAGLGYFQEILSQNKNKPQQRTHTFYFKRLSGASEMAHWYRCLSLSLMT